MLFTDIIRKKRDGQPLSRQEIEFFAAGLADGSLPAEQVSALAMAIFLNSMSAEEAGTLTRRMATSGTVLQWDDVSLGGPVVDKHSTGGVGDKVSFLLAPIAAACGAFVPMISGRGLGHTGGTTDKIESIPGYNATPDLGLFRKVVKSCGCAIIGQTPELAPADRRFYAIRDVTATVESVPLITASILSKKIAAGLDGLVMDVKVGSGAVMRTLDRAEVLARSIIETARASGLKTHALITDMNEVLGETAGNALEIAESLAYLRNERRESRLDEITKALTAEMLIVGGIESDAAKAMNKVEEAISSGRAAEKFGQMVAAMGGPGDLLENGDKHLAQAKVVLPVHATGDGYLSTVDAFEVGNAVIELGGGRRKQNDKLDLSVGFSDVVPIGTAVTAGSRLANVHAATEDTAALAAEMLQHACVLSEDAPVERPAVHERLES